IGIGLAGLVARRDRLAIFVAAGVAWHGAALLLAATAEFQASGAAADWLWPLLIAAGVVGICLAAGMGEPGEGTRDTGSLTRTPPAADRDAPDEPAGGTGD
ncbi:MAG: hypothetical protein KY476_05135, partial [Planctomycetes bacterium]|nr:hypothetical protein [Planctomycetota bacterium]